MIGELKPQYQISYRKGSKKIYAVDIKLRKHPYTKVLSLNVDPRIDEQMFLCPQFMYDILAKLNYGELIIPCLNK